MLLITHQSLAQKESESLGTVKFDAKSTKTASIFKHKTTGLVYFKADFDLDMDGSPRAYNASNTGIEDNGNAMNSKGEFLPNVILLDGLKKPILQNQTDPFPGFFISLTTLNLQNSLITSPKHYVNSDEIPYFVLPIEKVNKSVRIGDIGLIFNTLTKQSAFAIFADTNPNVIGEGSIALAKKLGINAKLNSKGKFIGGNENGDILYIVFPKSGKGASGYQDLTLEDVETLGNKAITKFGDKEKVIKMILDLMK